MRSIHYVIENVDNFHYNKGSRAYSEFALFWNTELGWVPRKAATCFYGDPNNKPVPYGGIVVEVINPENGAEVKQR